jgi:hypothetical protein
MEYTIYLDNSNVFIEGQKVSAVRKGLARDINYAASKKIKDHAYRLDFGKLIQITCGYDSLRGYLGKLCKTGAYPLS